MGYPVCIGTSRKSFIAHITGEQPGDRLYGSLAGIVSSLFAGVVIFRVHDVKATVSFLSVLHTLHNEKSKKTDC
jgi:dihydropteroate synthase